MKSYFVRCRFAIGGSMALLVGCVSPPEIRPLVTYDFSVQPQGSGLVITAPAGKQGVYNGGYARLKLTSALEQEISWTCPGKIDMEFKPMQWDSADPLPDKGKLTTKYENTTDAEVFTDPRKVTIRVSKKNLGKHDVVAYKYSITCDGVSEDPVIIINR